MFTVSFDDSMCGPKVFKRFLFSKSSLFHLLASFGFVLGSLIPILSRAVTCQAVPHVSKPADAEAEPEEPSGDVAHGEMDPIHGK